MTTRSLDYLRKPVKLPLAQGEEIVMYYTASYDAGSSLSSSWRFGNLYLTNKRLLFVQTIKIVFQILLSQMTNMSITKRGWILGKKVKQLSVSYNVSQGRRISHIAVRDPEHWKRVAEDLREGIEPAVAVCPLFSIGLAEPKPSKRVNPKASGTSNKIDAEAIEKLIDALDATSGDILWYLWENRHAKINELAQLVGAPTHMDVLLRIREKINPAAEKIISGPALSFEKSRVDQRTGEKVLFSWWLAGEVDERESEEKGPLVDVFDEGEHVSVLMELLGAREDDIRLEVAANKLIVSVNGPDRNYHEEVSLPEAIRSDQITWTFNNWMLQVKLRKVRQGGREMTTEEACEAEEPRSVQMAKREKKLVSP